jgi:hypothetical protein
MLKLNAYLTGFSSKSDGSASVRFSTQELTSEDFSTLKKYLNEFGYLLFKESYIKENEIPDEEPLEDDQKSPSKRLKAVLFLVWKKTGEKDEFNTYYRKQMEKFINVVKDKLE